MKKCRKESFMICIDAYLEALSTAGRVKAARLPNLPGGNS
jgi:hypothetical protein